MVMMVLLMFLMFFRRFWLMMVVVMRVIPIFATDAPIAVKCFARCQSGATD